MGFRQTHPARVPVADAVGDRQADKPAGPRLGGLALQRTIPDQPRRIEIYSKENQGPTVCRGHRRPGQPRAGPHDPRTTKPSPAIARSRIPPVLLYGGWGVSPCQPFGNRPAAPEWPPGFSRARGSHVQPHSPINAKSPRRGLIRRWLVCPTGHVLGTCKILRLRTILNCREHQPGYIEKLKCLSNSIPSKSTGLKKCL